MELNGLICADVPLSNYSLTHSLWVGTKHSLSQYDPFPVLQLGLDLITSSDYIRLLGAKYDYVGS